MFEIMIIPNTRLLKAKILQDPFDMVESNALSNPYT